MEPDQRAVHEVRRTLLVKSKEIGRCDHPDNCNRSLFVMFLTRRRFPSNVQLVKQGSIWSCSARTDAPRQPTKEVQGRMLRHITGLPSGAPYIHVLWFGRLLRAAPGRSALPPATRPTFSGVAPRVLVPPLFSPPSFASWASHRVPNVTYAASTHEVAALRACGSTRLQVAMSL